jgi:hypothetical protein
VPKRGIKLLGDWPVVAKPFRIIIPVIPGRETEIPNLRQNFITVDTLEVLLLVPVGSEGIGHRSFNDRDIGVTQANLVAGIDSSMGANGSSISEGIRGYVRLKAQGSVVIPGRISRQRAYSTGGIAKSGSVVLERSLPDAGVR